MSSVGVGIAEDGLGRREHPCWNAPVCMCRLHLPEQSSKRQCSRLVNQGQGTLQPLLQGYQMGLRAYSNINPPLDIVWSKNYASPTERTHTRRCPGSGRYDDAFTDPPAVCLA